MRLVLITVLVLSCLAGGAASALADAGDGHYTVRACPSTAAPTDVARGGWTFSVFPADAPLRSAMTTCGPDGVFGLDLRTGTTASTAGALWSLSVPNGVAIDRVRLERRVTVSQGYWYALQTDVGGVREYTTRSSASDPAPPTEWTAGAFALNGSRWISVILACVESTPCTPTEPQTVAVRGFEADLVDESAPTIQYKVATDQLPPVKPSTFTISVDSSDVGSGVKTIAVLIDGVVAGQASGTGSCATIPYTVPGPCPLYSHLSAPIAREAMERGTGQLEIEAVDAAGNRTRTPAVPLSKFGYAISAPAPSAPPAVLTFAFKGTTKPSITSRYDAPPTITGLLRDSNGAALPGVAVRIDTRLLVRGAAFAPLRTVTTDKHGAFTLRLPRGPSREIQATALTGDAASVALLRTTVTAPVHLTSSRRSTRNRHAVTFAGSVPGTPKGARTRVDLQAWGAGGRWLTFASPTLRHGKFSASYRFTRTFSTSTYRFRAVLRTDEDFPYAAGKSREIRVRVRP